MHTDIITKDLEKVVKAIDANHVIAFPTGTVYGLAVNALSPLALDTLRIIKKRPEEKTFTVFLKESLVKDFFEVTDFENSFLRKAKNLPITVLLKPKNILNHLEQEGVVGLRIIDHPLMQELAEAVRYPLTATSANISNHDACLTPDCIGQELPAVSCVYGDTLLKVSPSSTIVRFNKKEMHIVREGSLSRKELANLI